MGGDVESRGASVAIHVGNASANLNIGHGIVNRRVIAVGEPEFGRDMAVLEDDGGETRHGVVKVRNAELATGLARHKVGIHIVAYTRRSIRVNINGEALGAEE